MDGQSNTELRDMECTDVQFVPGIKMCTVTWSRRGQWHPHDPGSELMERLSIVEPRRLQRMADLIAEIRSNDRIADMMTCTANPSRLEGFDINATHIQRNLQRAKLRQMLVLIDTQELVQLCRDIVKLAGDEA